MPETPRPSLLDELRQRSEALQAQRAAARLPEEQARHAIDGALWRAFRWLDEAMGHLEIIRPDVRHRFQLGDYLTFDSLQIDSGFAAFRRHGLGTGDRLEQVEMFYRLAAPKPAVVRVSTLTAVAVEERLRAAALHFHSDNELDKDKIVRNTLFHVEPTIRASVRFKPDYRQHAIDVMLRNVDRFESVMLEFEPSAIDEAALEDLVRLVLGESNAFLHRAPLAYVNSRRA
ncbi:MAG TPA: hypothetical protein VFJ48_10710 [Casimicrobiaceae bacterium]|nr:hypothetical protein [Casimicrobiaceae bacterium]